MHRGLLNVPTCFTLLSSIATYSWQCVESLGNIYAFTAFYGLFAGALQSLASQLPVPKTHVDEAKY